LKILFIRKIAICFILFFLFISKIKSQLCSGSLGDPIININFGTSNQPSSPLPAGVTGLAYLGGCPGDGQYCIRDVNALCTSQWLTIRDHTVSETGIDGYMMLINAANTPINTNIYSDTARGLCGNTNYQFAAWIANTLRSSSCNSNPLQPNLNFSIKTIEGKQLAYYNTGDILATAPNATWNQYGISFKTPDTVTSVIFSITTNTKTGCGNTFVLDDITIKPCGAKIAAVVQNNLTDTIEFCENNQKNLLLMASFTVGFTDPVIQWQISKDTGKTWIDIPGEQNQNFTRTISGAGIYEYRAAVVERVNFNSIQCRIVSNVILIKVTPFPVGPTNTSIIGCTNTSVSLNAIEAGVLNYLWTGPNGYTSTLSSVFFPYVNYQDSGLYQVIVNTTYGCILTDTFKLLVYPGVVLSVSPDTAGVCQGKSIQLKATGGTFYNWTPIEGLSDTNSPNPFASPADTLTYQVVVTNQAGCKDSGWIRINVWISPLVNAGNGQSIFEGNSVTLNGTISGSSVNFNWTPTISMMNSNSLTPIVQPDNTTTYTLNGVSEVGCGDASSEVTINVYKKIVVPNAFSPNGDGINDTWVITNLDTYPNSQLKVFSRWGQLVFESKANNKIWDGTYNGKTLSNGVYYYIIEVNEANIKPISGSVLIIR